MRFQNGDISSLRISDLSVTFEMHQVVTTVTLSKIKQGLRFVISK